MFLFCFRVYKLVHIGLLHAAGQLQVCNRLLILQSRLNGLVQVGHGSSHRRERKLPMPLNVRAGNGHLVTSAHILLARASHMTWPTLSEAEKHVTVRVGRE